MNYKYKLKKIIFKLLNKKSHIMDIEIEYYRSLGVKIGNGVRSFSPLTSAEPYLLEVGDNVTVSSQVAFITHDNSVSKIIKNKTDVFGRIKIGNNCFIGHNTTVLPGVEIGDNTIIGAGSVVTKSFKMGNVVVAGNPAKIITSTEEYKNKILEFSLNTLNMNFAQKKEFLMTNEDKLLTKNSCI
ncbi:MAG: acyltransferase [Paraclostridium bifermentans]|uniref:acyltransferase n=1 Tax=Paraclostridium bifermentans TaxID=1490 RepID=UPI001D414E5B|nr:acyltransferase [Paraclostridium bifermentans]MBS6509126.1 acyltransferase [Paraclostridium bifermentans]